MDEAGPPEGPVIKSTADFPRLLDDAEPAFPTARFSFIWPDFAALITHQFDWASSRIVIRQMVCLTNAYLNRMTSAWPSSPPALHSALTPLEIKGAFTPTRENARTPARLPRDGSVCRNCGGAVYTTACPLRLRCGARSDRSRSDSFAGPAEIAYTIGTWLVSIYRSLISDQVLRNGASANGETASRPAPV